MPPNHAGQMPPAPQGPPPSMQAMNMQQMVGLRAMQGQAEPVPKKIWVEERYGVPALEVLVTSEEREAEEFINQHFANAPLVGVDVKFCPQIKGGPPHATSIVQLSCGTSVLVFDLMHGRHLPQCVRKMLEAQNHVCAGMGTTEIFGRLLFEHGISGCRTLDLARDSWPQIQEWRHEDVTTLGNVLFQFQIPSAKAMDNTNWNERPLLEKQIAFAATMAYLNWRVTFHLFERYGVPKNDAWVPSETVEAISAKYSETGFIPLHPSVREPPPRPYDPQLDMNMDFSQTGPFPGFGLSQSQNLMGFPPNVMNGRFGVPDGSGFPAPQFGMGPGRPDVMDFNQSFLQGRGGAPPNMGDDGRFGPQSRAGGDGRRDDQRQVRQQEPDHSYDGFGFEDRRPYGKDGGKSRPMGRGDDRGIAQDQMDARNFAQEWSKGGGRPEPDAFDKGKGYRGTKGVPGKGDHFDHPMPEETMDMRGKGVGKGGRFMMDESDALHQQPFPMQAGKGGSKGHKGDVPDSGKGVYDTGKGVHHDKGGVKGMSAPGKGPSALDGKGVQGQHPHAGRGMHSGGDGAGKGPGAPTAGRAGKGMGGAGPTIPEQPQGGKGMTQEGFGRGPGDFGFQDLPAKGGVSMQGKGQVGVERPGKGGGAGAGVGAGAGGQDRQGKGGPLPQDRVGKGGAPMGKGSMLQEGPGPGAVSGKGGTPFGGKSNVQDKSVGKGGVPNEKNSKGALSSEKGFGKGSQGDKGTGRGFGFAQDVGPGKGGMDRARMGPFGKGNDKGFGKSDHHDSKGGGKGYGYGKGSPFGKGGDDHKGGSYGRPYGGKDSMYGKGSKGSTGKGASGKGGTGKSGKGTAGRPGTVSGLSGSKRPPVAPERTGQPKAKATPFHSSPHQKAAPKPAGKVEPTSNSKASLIVDAGGRRVAPQAKPAGKVAPVLPKPAPVPPAKHQQRVVAPTSLVSEASKVPPKTAAGSAAASVAGRPPVGPGGKPVAPVMPVTSATVPPASSSSQPLKAGARKPVAPKKV